MAIIKATLRPTYQHEWEEFEVPPPGEESPTQKCALLTEIAHVAHVHNALSIVQDGQFRPRLISDESKLRTTRTLVTWLSPKEWPQGSRYGNVSFVFNWQGLLEIPQVKFYWVEIIRYGPPACRILLTTKDHPDLEAYDPTSHRGPWKWNKDAGVHLWNEKITLEVMVESELQLQDVIRIDFIRHHQTQCCIDWRVCKDKGFDVGYGGSLFLAGLLAGEMPALTELLRPGETQPAHHSVMEAGGRIAAHLYKCKCNGTVTANDPVAIPLVRGILAAYARRNDADCLALAALFRTTDDLVATYYALLPIVAQ
jgi:hypothetical protein